MTRDSPQHNSVSQLPPFSTWPELTWYMMLRGIDWNKPAYAPHQRDNTPKAPRYLILQTPSLSRDLMAMTKLCLSEAHFRDSENAISDWPGKKSEIGSVCHGALLGQPENFMFAELLASHKGYWGNKVLGRVTIFRGVSSGVKDPFPTFTLKVQDNSAEFRDAYRERLATTRESVGNLPSSGKSGSQSADASGRSGSSGRLGKRTGDRARSSAQQSEIVVRDAHSDVGEINTTGIISDLHRRVPWSSIDQASFAKSL